DLSLQSNLNALSLITTDPNLAAAISREPDLRKEILLAAFAENQTLNRVRIARAVCDRRVQSHCRLAVLTAKRHKLSRHSLDVVHACVQCRLAGGKLERNLNPHLARRLPLRVYHRKPEEHTENCNHPINFVFHKNLLHLTERDSRRKTGSKNVSTD